MNNGSFTADIDIALFTMVVIGGLGSLPGVVVGRVRRVGAPRTSCPRAGPTSSTVAASCCC